MLPSNLAAPFNSASPARLSRASCARTTPTSLEKASMSWIVHVPLSPPTPTSTPYYYLHLSAHLFARTATGPCGSFRPHLLALPALAHPPRLSLLEVVSKCPIQLMRIQASEEAMQGRLKCQNSGRQLALRLFIGYSSFCFQSVAFTFGGSPGFVRKFPV